MTDKVYFILDEKNDIVKIGQTKRIDKRFSGVCQGHPYLKLLGTIEGCDGATEEVLHSLLGNHRVAKEWFNYTDTKPVIDYLLRNQVELGRLTSSDAIETMREMRAEGKRFREIAEHLNQQGKRTRRGKPYTAQNVAYLLQAV